MQSCPDCICVTVKDSKDTRINTAHPSEQARYCTMETSWSASGSPAVTTLSRQAVEAAHCRGAGVRLVIPGSLTLLPYTLHSLFLTERKQ